jgi:hypothetical protein
VSVKEIKRKNHLILKSSSELSHSTLKLHKLKRRYNFLIYRANFNMYQRMNLIRVLHDFARFNVIIIITFKVLLLIASCITSFHHSLILFPRDECEMCSLKKVFCKILSSLL